MFSIIAPGGNSLEYRYDGSLPTRATSYGVAPGTIDVRYDNNLRVVSQTIDLTDSINFTYDRDGLLRKVGDLKLGWDSGNGLFKSDTLGSIVSSVAYSPTGEMSNYEVRNGASILFKTIYERDSLGRITKLTETVLDTTNIFEYSYDVVGRLHEVKRNGEVTATYFYDANGNRDSVVTPSGTTRGTYDAQDRMLTYGDAQYLYTDNGELRAKIEGIDTTWYRYDNFGNLTQVLLPDGTNIEYVIDGQNRRIGKKVNGRFVQKFLYSGQLLPIAELDSSNQVVARFMPGYMVKGGKTYRLITDHLGSIRMVVDLSDGSIAQRMDYNAWGNVLLDSNPGFQPFGYAGGLYDERTVMIRFGARDYDLITDRWTCKDPIGLGDGLNPFIYCSNDPINFNDPFGNELVPVYLPGVGPTYLERSFAQKVMLFIRLANNRGVALNFREAFRTPKTQESLKKRLGKKAAKNSLHCTGNAVDVDFESLRGELGPIGLTTLQQQQIINDAAKASGLTSGNWFGEPWHFYSDPGGDRIKNITQTYFEYNMLTFNTTWIQLYMRTRF